MSNNTQVLDAIHDTENSLARAVELLDSGELVAFPTETVYGLGAKIFDESAVRKIFLAKGRPQDNPLIAHIAAIGDVERIAANVPEKFYRLAGKFFPGPLTIVLQRHTSVPAPVSAGLDTIALRMPDNEIALRLIGRAGEPLVAPSANLSGRPSPTSAQHVLEDLDGRIAAIVDGGPCRVGIESTVVNLLQNPPVVLRPGIISPEDISEALGETVEISMGFDEKISSPGMKYRHYAPLARIIIAEHWEEVLPIIEGTPGRKRLILTNSLPEERSVELAYSGIFPATLYAEFRRADKEGCEEIILVCDPEIRSHAGLMNRINKAAGRM